MTNRATQVAKQTIILHAARAAVDAVGTVPPRPKGAEIFWCLGPAVLCTATYLAAVFMQDKRRRNDFASTEVGEATGGRVTQQAFEVVYKKDSGISNAAMPGTRGDGRKVPKKIPLL